MLNDLLITIIAYGIYLFVSSNMVPTQVAMGYLGLENKYRRLNSGLETSNNMIYHSLDSIKSIEDEDMRTDDNWYPLDDVCHRWHTTTLEHAATQFLKAQQMARTENHIRSLKNGELRKVSNLS